MLESRFREELLEVLREMRDIMATLDEDVTTATTVINNLVTALGAASGSGVPAADQTALETAIAAGQAALAPAAPAPVPAAPAAPEPVVTDPAVS